MCCHIVLSQFIQPALQILQTINSPMLKTCEKEGKSDAKTKSVRAHKHHCKSNQSRQRPAHDLPPGLLSTHTPSESPLLREEYEAPPKRKPRLKAISERVQTREETGTTEV